MLNGQTYAESEIWSQQNSIWKSYKSRKRRLPKDSDFTEKWYEMKQHKPVSLNAMKMTHNEAAISSLLIFSTPAPRNSSLTSGTLPQSMILHGPKGSGRTVIIESFLRDYATQFLKMMPSMIPKLMLSLDCLHFLSANELRNLWKRIGSFAELPFSGNVPVNYRIVVLDNADAITPSNQMNIKVLNEKYEHLKWIYICIDPHKLIQYVQLKSYDIRIGEISEVNCLKVLIRACVTSQIGFNREGMHAIFLAWRWKQLKQLAPEAESVTPAFSGSTPLTVTRFDGNTLPEQISSLNDAAQSLKNEVNVSVKYSLTDLFTLLQNIFIKYSYISEENVYRYMVPKAFSKPRNLPEWTLPPSESKTSFGMASQTIDASAALDPKSRCSVCTLIPPCRHITKQHLADYGMAIRTQLMEQDRQYLASLPESVPLSPDKLSKPTNIETRRRSLIAGKSTKNLSENVPFVSSIVRFIPAYHKTGHKNEINFSSSSSRPKSVPCSEFLNFGRCSLFNKYGTCPFLHPEGYHTLINRPSMRCATCTLPWPCHHCAYSAERDSLINKVLDIEQRMVRLKYLLDQLVLLEQAESEVRHQRAKSIPAYTRNHKLLSIKPVAVGIEGLSIEKQHQLTALDPSWRRSLPFLYNTLYSASQPDTASSWTEQSYAGTDASSSNALGMSSTWTPSDDLGSTSMSTSLSLSQGASTFTASYEFDQKCMNYNLHYLNETKVWIDTSYSTNASDYSSTVNYLNYIFYYLVWSPLLEVTVVSLG